MRRFLVLAAALALLAGGCGIPDDTDVRVIGAGPSAGFAAGNDDQPSEPPTRQAANDPATLVTNYLQAAAGDPENALNRVKAFLSDDAKVGFEAGPDIRVIRLTNDLLYTPGDPEVSFSALQVGTLKSNGVLESAPESKPAEYKLKVSPIAGQSGFFVTDVQQQHVLLLTDTALEKFFLRRTIYFWNSDNTGLIPDMRYMPRSVPRVQQPTTILNWLVNGPASWLGDSARGLPNGTTAPDNVPAAAGDTLQVTLSAQAVPSGDGKALERLRRQLQWSLGELITRTLQLKIGNQDPVGYSGLDYQDSNVASRLVDQPERFVIYSGTIRRLASSPQSGEAVPVVKIADNKGFSAAAISASATHTYFAAVTGTGKSRKLRVAVARTGQQSDLVDVAGITGEVGRPVWAVTPDNDPGGAIGLVTVGGKLYSFGVGGKSAPVDWQGNPGAIRAISVAPDGYRVALVAGGKLYRTVLDTGGDTLSMSAPETLLPPNFSSVAAVAWSSETYLAVAGTRADGRSAVMDVSIDGALTYPRLTDIGKETVTDLTAYPANPLSPEQNSDSESYETAGDAWDVLGEPIKITAADLAGPAVTPQAGVTPTAPFFLD
ncbi:LpqB family beta-propeller domain-containing protein [Actinoplanes sp. NPDC026619]|uniref:LpqB family beta-propeller domain-containing protein n=1 Tax=Actinoplanes sp. NPDC026619 TaxID=3155798 RepID=UPI0033F10899